jgi:endothelin-converting enzyme/putative endopeptidase
MRSAAILASFGVAALVFACGGETPPPANPQPPPVMQMPADKISGEPPAPTGVDKSALDPSVKPCDDFYQYACGNWMKATQIPADESSWSRSFNVIHDRNEEILHQILESYAKGENQSEPYAKALGDFYGSCMDEAAIEAAGVKPLEPWFKAIDAVNSPAALTKLLGRMQAELGSGIVFDIGAAQDFTDANQVLGQIWQAGLGMPERDYYLDAKPKFAELRQKYEAHVAAMLQLAGDKDDKAKASAKKIMEIETQLAKASMTKEDLRKPKLYAHRTVKADLAKTAPGIDWNAWLDGAKAKDVKLFNVGQPDFLKAAGGMFTKTPIADWKTYLRWHILRIHGNELSAKFVDEKFKWRKELTGADKLPARWKRCVRTIDGLMGEALAQPFVKKTLGNEGKANVVGMVQAIEKVMHGNIEHIGWMDEPTKKAAFAKLAKIGNKIAYPDKWRDYSKLEIVKGNYVQNSQKAEAFEYGRQLAKMDKPVDRSEWQMSPPTVNAYYDPQLNEMVFPAGILQPPFYSNATPRPTNYGGIGMVMGHELTHGFDDEGRQFDADGNLKDWWAKSVNDEFERRASCVKKQFDDYTVLDGVHINGELTLGENIADLGGVKLGLKALQAQPPLPPGGKPEFSQEQEYFLGFAQGWCTKMRDEQLRTLVATNPHSPPHLRVNGPLSNLPEFAKAFSCEANAKMMKKDRCEVW